MEPADVCAPREKEKQADKSTRGGCVLIYTGGAFLMLLRGYFGTVSSCKEAFNMKLGTSGTGTFGVSGCVIRYSVQLCNRH